MKTKWAQPDVVTDHVRLSALGRERAEIEDAVTAYRRLRELEDEIAATETMAREESDPEMAALAREELDGLTQRTRDPDGGDPPDARAARPDR